MGICLQFITRSFTELTHHHWKTTWTNEMMKLWFKWQSEWRPMEGWEDFQNPPRTPLSLSIIAYISGFIFKSQVEITSWLWRTDDLDKDCSRPQSAGLKLVHMCDNWWPTIEPQSSGEWWRFQHRNCQTRKDLIMDVGKNRTFHISYWRTFTCIGSLGRLIEIEESKLMRDSILVQEEEWHHIASDCSIISAIRISGNGGQTRRTIMRSTGEMKRPEGEK